MQEIGRCKVCFAMDEDLMHALVHCSHAKMFWAEAYSWLGVRRPHLHPGTWSRDILCDDQYTNVQRAQMISVMWAIWHSRNRITHDGESLDPVTTVRRIKEDLAVLEIPRACAAVLPGHGWRPPDPGVIKVNTDAAMCMDSDKCGVGGVARSNTSLLGAWSKPHLGVTDPFIGETLALRDGVIFAKLRGFSHVIMETDCLEVVNLWNSRHNSRSVVAPVLVEIGELASSFDSFCIQHVMRSANVPAHLCAKHASTLTVTESWTDDRPPFLLTSLLADDARSTFVE